MLEFLNNISESELEGKSRIRKLIYVLHKGLLGIKLSYYEETRIYLYYKFYLPCMNVKNIYRTSYKIIESQDINEIIDFSGLGSYISLPIKTYSEGMSARLIFSILTSSPHDCLAIDEGFGTGDADFCDRAEERMKQFMESAATLFLASHSEELLKQFCNRGIVFSHGSIAFDGPLDAALNYYHTHDYYRKNVIG